MKTRWWGLCRSQILFVSVSASLCPLICPLCRPNTCQRGSYNKKVRFGPMHPEITQSSWQISIGIHNDYYSNEDDV